MSEGLPIVFKVAHWQVPAAARLKRMLKHAGRSCGLKCVLARPFSPVAAAPDRTEAKEPKRPE